MIICISSYLPDDEKLRKARLDSHRKQIEKLSILNCKIIVNAQNYHEDEYIIDDNITYLNKHDKGIGLSNSRNELLNYFYNSDEDWCMLCDDDAYFYNYYDILDFFDELKQTPDKFKELDFIRGIFASKRPYKRTVYDNPYNINYYCFNDEQTIGSIALCIIKNLKKYYNKEIYMNIVEAKNGEGYEDKQFCCELKLNNIKTHVLQTFIMATYNYTENSTIFKTYDERMELHERNNVLPDRYKCLFDDKNRLLRQYKDKPIMIERNKKMIITENLIPKNKTGEVGLF